MAASTVEIDGPLTVPAALAAARKHKVARKSAKGRKLMRWGPDEDQQLLLATEAVVIEGSVELDWNLVGLKMANQVTGEGIKQHLQKVRNARESAGMITPAKAEGRSVFGTRRGVTRYPPVVSNADPTGVPGVKKRSRPDPKTSRSQSKVVEDKSDWVEDELPSKGIKHASLLFQPAIPKAELPIPPSPTPAGTSPTPKQESESKRKAKEESGEEDFPASQPPTKRSRKTKTSTELVGDEEPKARKGRRPARPKVVSNFDLTTRLEYLRKKADGIADAADGPPITPNPMEKDVKPMPTPKEHGQSKPKKTAGTPTFSQRPLRNKLKLPDYCDEKQALPEDPQSELYAADADAKDSLFEPEMADTVTLNKTRMPSLPVVLRYEPPGAEVNARYGPYEPEATKTVIKYENKDLFLSEGMQSEAPGPEVDAKDGSYEPEAANTAVLAQNPSPLPTLDHLYPSDLNWFGQLEDLSPFPENLIRGQPASINTSLQHRQQRPALRCSGYEHPKQQPVLRYPGYGHPQQSEPRYPPFADFEQRPRGEASSPFPVDLLLQQSVPRYPGFKSPSQDGGNEEPAEPVDYSHIEQGTQPFPPFDLDDWLNSEEYQDQLCQ